MIGPPNPELLLPWVLRIVWIVVAVSAGDAIDVATAGRSTAVAAVATFGAAALWILGVAAMAIPSVVSLTATRMIVPLGVPSAAVAWGADGGATSIVWLAFALLATIAALSGELGRAFVQASAYGAEDRHLLRPPPAYALAAFVTWALWATALIVGPLLLAARHWPVGIPVTAVALALGLWSWPRWHRLARRWLVIVPAGFVIHDHLVLAETLMIRRSEIGSSRLAPSDTRAVDLTGPAGGHAVEIRTTEPVTAILAATPRAPARPIHLRACLVAPTRPGRFLTAVAERNFRVG